MLVSDLFDIYQGNSFELINMNIDNASDINFVARTSENNGVVATVSKVDEMPFPAGLITVAVGGSVLSSFVQDKAFYTGFHVLVLKPKKEMSLEEKLFYCHAIKMNAYRYSYGRQANRTLKNINLPPLPDWLKKYKVDYKKVQTKIKHKDSPFDPILWKRFIVSDLFDVKLSSGDLKQGDIVSDGVPLISANSDNNGFVGYVAENKDDRAQKFKSNVLTVDMFCNAFYQHQDFFAVSHGRVNILIPKFDMNKYIGLFIATIINKERFRFNYGRAVYSGVIAGLSIKLPVDKNGNPDWGYMENYIKSLPYTDLI